MRMPTASDTRHRTPRGRTYLKRLNRFGHQADRFNPCTMQQVQRFNNFIVRDVFRTADQEYRFSLASRRRFASAITSAPAAAGTASPPHLHAVLPLPPETSTITGGSSLLFTACDSVASGRSTSTLCVMIERRCHKDQQQHQQDIQQRNDVDLGLQFATSRVHVLWPWLTPYCFRWW